MSFGRLNLYRSIEQLGRMEDRDWTGLLDQLLDLPGAEGFRAICDLFSFWPTGPERRRQLARALQRMQSWDDDVRAVSSSYAGLYEGARLSDVATLARSIEVHRRDTQGSSELFAIATSEHVSELAGLSVTGSHAGTRAWNALGGSPALPGLRRLAIHGSSLGEAGVRALLTSSALSALRALELVSVGLRPEVLPRSWPGTPLPQLHEIDLSHNILGSEGVLQLAVAPWFPQLRSLVVRDNSVSQDGVEALLQSPHAGQLGMLDARDNGLSGDDAAVLRALAARRRIELLL